MAKTTKKCLNRIELVRKAYMWPWGELSQVPAMQSRVSNIRKDREPLKMSGHNKAQISRVNIPKSIIDPIK